MRASKIVGYGVFLLIAISVGVGMIQIHKASASTFGAALNTGYYDQTLYNPNNRRFFFLDGVPNNWAANPNGTTAAAFITTVRDYLYNTGPNAVIHQQEHADARASVMINTMMGVQSQDPRYDLNPALQRWQNGVILAKSLFNQWAAVVTAYDTPGNVYGGTVNFNDFITNTNTQEINGSGIGDPNLPITGDSLTAPRGIAHGDFPDVVFAPLGQIESNYGITFTHKNGTRFQIKKWCGNLIGDETPFPLDWQHQALNNPMTPPGIVKGGPTTNLTFVGTAQNIGSTPSGGGTLYGMVQQDSLTPQPISQLSFNALAPGAFSPALTYTYNIPAYTAAGSTFCFFSMVDPKSIAGGQATSGRTCYQLAYTSYPAIQGLNGDVHAGGGICGGLLQTGNVKGNANALSVGDYVVASSGLVSDFKSNGTGANNNLVAGATGGYSRACRADLMQNALLGRTSNSAVITATSVDLTTLTGIGKPDVYYYDGGGPLTISGTINTKITIVVTLGSVKIGGPVLLLANKTYAPRDSPSLGIISQGDIVIDPLVTRVDAFLFSNGVIDTCDPGSTIGGTCATPQLVVNGFLMGKNILFNRIGKTNTSGAQVSEKVTLMPELYLNPPKFFDEAAQDVLQSQGEKPPLY